MIQNIFTQRVLQVIVVLFIVIFTAGNVAAYSNGRYRHTPDGKWEHKIKYRTKCYCWPFSYKHRYKCCPWAYKWIAVSGPPPNAVGPPAPEDVDNGGGGGNGGGPPSEPPGPKCGGPSPGNVGDPINIFTGNLFEAVQDLEFSSPNHRQLHFKRFYNSQSKSVGILGLGWTHSFSAFLKPTYEFNGETYLKIVDETGRGVYFQQQTDSYFAGAFKEKSDVVAEDGNFVWRRLDNSRFVFSAEGKLIWIEDSVGNRLAITYTDDGYIETVYNEASGRLITFHYEGVHNNGSSNGDTGQTAEVKKLVYISGPATDAVENGVWVSYGYDQSKLVSTIYPDNSGFDYAYGENNQLTEKKDKSGHILSQWAYENNKAVYNFTPDGRGVTIGYIDDNHVQVTDAYGQTRTYAIFYYHGRPRVYDISHANGCQDCGGGLTQLDYDDSMNVTRAAYSSGRVTTYSDHDNRGRPKKIVRGAGTPEEKTIALTYHPDIDEILTRTKPSLLGDGNIETIWDYDSDGNEIANENPGRLAHRKIERGFTHDDSGTVVPYEYITIFEYNVKGRVTAINGPLPGDQDKITYTYDPFTGDRLTETRPLVGAITYQYDVIGNMISMTDINGVTSTLTYDGRNRLLSTTTNGVTTTRTYTASGEPDTTTDAIGCTLTYTYNAAGLLEKIIDPSGNYMFYGYNEQGRRIEESIFAADGIQTRYRGYDYGDPANYPDLVPGKPWKMLWRNYDDTADLETVYAYDSSGNIKSVTDANNNTTYYSYDLFNRLERVEQTGDVVTTCSYDTHGNLISVTDAEGHETTYIYDDLGHLMKTDSPDTGTTRYCHDEAGNMTKKNQNGEETDYKYDALNRLTAIRYADSRQDVTFRYDSGSGDHLNGSLAEVIDPSGTYEYSYDAQGNLKSKVKVIDNITYITGYEYDDAGNLRRIIYPTGHVVDYLPDATDPGRIASVAIAAYPVSRQVLSQLHRHQHSRHNLPAFQQHKPRNKDLQHLFTKIPRSTNNGVRRILADGIIYQPFGPISAMELGNNIHIIKTFDKNYQLTNLQADSVQDLAITPDAVGNIEYIFDNLDPARSQSITYDTLYRLIAADGSYGDISYIYDKAGNRLTRTHDGQTDTYTYQVGTSRLSQIDGNQTQAFDYDLHGNITQANTRALKYNATHRLARVEQDNSVTAEYTYNAFGQRIKKTVNNETVVYHYDQSGQLIAETINGQAVRCNIYLHGQRLAVVESRIADRRRGKERIFYAINDHLGTPQKLTDSNGTVVWDADYLPFGEVDVIIDTIKNEVRFPGQYYDAETGLHYNWHRYYDPSMGRYLTPDPIGLAGGINLYLYVSNNPVNWVDPLGLEVIIFGRGPFINIPRSFRVPNPRYVPKPKPRTTPKPKIRNTPDNAKGQPPREGKINPSDGQFPHDPGADTPGPMGGGVPPEASHPYDEFFDPCGYI